MANCNYCDKDLEQFKDGLSFASKPFMTIEGTDETRTICADCLIRMLDKLSALLELWPIKADLMGIVQDNDQTGQIWPELKDTATVSPL